MSEEFQRCAQWRSVIMDRLRVSPPKLVVVSSARAYSGNGSAIWGPAGFKSYDEAWLNGLNSLVRELRDAGSQVLVLGPVPAPGTVTALCLSGHLTDVSKCAFSRRADLNAHGIDEERSAVVAGGGQYVDVSDLFCRGDRCPVVVGGTVVYFDGSHLTYEYSTLLAPAMGALADRAMADSGAR